jgi:hypothetical protein
MLGRMRLPADRRAGVPRGLGAVALALTVLTGCADRQETYCDAVEDRQQELGEVLGSGSPDALLRALPIFDDLADQAPDDIRDEWKTVIEALEGLQQALEDAGVDPATYDRERPPEGLSQTDQDTIGAAASRLAGEGTVTAFSAVDQHAKDVCGTPLQIG